jgi:hypothetical protein
MSDKPITSRQAIKIADAAFITGVLFGFGALWPVKSSLASHGRLLRTWFHAC